MTEEECNKSIQLLLQPIDAEIRNYVYQNFVENCESPSQDPNAFVIDIVNKYEPDLDLILCYLERYTGTALTESERKDFELLIIKEQLHGVYIEYMENSLERLTIMSGTNEYNRDVTPSICDENITLYQVAVDIYGGIGRDGANKDYNVDGGNQLYKTERICETNPTRVVYRLYFKDEDHPFPPMDQMYDVFRLFKWLRFKDIEEFIVMDNQIFFFNIWDNDMTYADGKEWKRFDVRQGPHGNITREYSSTVYINTWNHAMDIYDKNPTMNKVKFIYNTSWKSCTWVIPPNPF